MQPLIIIGTGLAGYSVAREFRKLNKSTPLLIISADSGDFYSKPALSNAFAQNKDEASLITQTAAQMAEQLGATILTHTRVERIDSEAHQLSTSAGQFGYSQVVIATGATPIRLQLAGDASHEVIAVNHLSDYARLRQRLRQLLATRDASGCRILIMGAGLIGCEFADDLASQGLQVSLVDPNPRPLGSLAPLAIGQGLQQALSGRGVRILSANSVRSIDYVTNQPTYQVSLQDAQQIEVDLVLSAVGMRPDLSLAQSSGLACQRGILVNRYGQTSATDVYALGDVAQYQRADGNHVWLPYIAPLLSAAKALASSLNGQALAIPSDDQPVQVKTPSYPVSLITPGPDQAGYWHTQHHAEHTVARFLDTQQVVRGFAVAPATLALRKSLLAELGTCFSAHTAEA